MGGKRHKRGSRQLPTQSARTTPSEDGPIEQQLVLRAAAMLVEHSGPLPPPAILERYDAIVPGGAERIFGWVDQQSAHRRELEHMRVAGDVKNERLGQHYAFVLSLLIVGAAGLLIWTGKSVMGLSLVLADVAALAGAFLVGRHWQRKERAEKLRELYEAPEPER